MKYLILLLLAATATLAAEDGIDLALWRFGEGTIDGKPAGDGAVIRPGQTVSAGDRFPLRLALAGCPGSNLILAAGSTVRLGIEREGQAMDLIAEVPAGAIQFDLPDKGAFRALLVRGGAMQVRVTGTVFMFERVRHDEDYLAMVTGKVKVKLLKILGQGNSDELELGGRQGISAGANGFGAVDQLASRPQLTAAAAERSGLRTQGLGAGGGWDADTAFAATSLMDAVASSVANTVANTTAQTVIADQVADQVLLQTLDATVQEVVNQAIATPPGANDPIQGPPGHP